MSDTACAAGPRPAKSARQWPSRTAPVGAGGGCPDPDRNPLWRTLLTVLTVLSMSRANADHPAAGAALTAERDVDAQGPQERLRPAQSAGERARAFGPAVPGNAVTAATGARTQEIGRATCPRAALGHDLPRPGGDRVGIDNALGAITVAPLGGARAAAGVAAGALFRKAYWFSSLFKGLMGSALLRQHRLHALQR